MIEAAQLLSIPASGLVQRLLAHLAAGNIPFDLMKENPTKELSSQRTQGLPDTRNSLSPKYPTSNATINLRAFRPQPGPDQDPTP